MVTDLLQYIDSEDKITFYNKVDSSLKNKKKEFIVTANPEIIMLATNDIDMKNIITNLATYVIPDGIGIVKALFYKCNKACQRNTGIDLVLHLLSEADKNGYSCFFYGAKPDIIRKFVDKCHESYPNIKILDYSDGYVVDRDDVNRRIIDSNADIVLVALGAPNQERVISKIFPKVDKGIFVGVGGSFDVLSGDMKRAPKFFINNNLEWLYRIVTQPKRLKRFFSNNVKFIFQIFFERK